MLTPFEKRWQNGWEVVSADQCRKNLEGRRGFPSLPSLTFPLPLLPPIPAWVSHAGSILIYRCIQSALKQSQDYRDDIESTDWAQVKDDLGLTADDLKVLWVLINKEVRMCGHWVDVRTTIESGRWVDVHTTIEPGHWVDAHTTIESGHWVDGLTPTLP